MNWFIYLLKTPWTRKKQDWAEYKNLKQNLENAEINFWNMQRQVQHTFLEEESYDEYDACLKERVMFVRVKPFGGIVHESEMLRFMTSRCQNFVPEENEQLCPCKECPAYNKNKELFVARQDMLNIQNKYEHFWKQKFNQNIK